MKYNLGERARLYEYVSELVEDAEPIKGEDSKFNAFDIQQLVGMKVKTLWKEKNGFQSVDNRYSLL